MNSESGITITPTVVVHDFMAEVEESVGVGVDIRAATVEVGV